LNAFEREMVELLPRLRRLGRVLARDGADADDLVQLTLERALARRAQWRPGTSLASWMFRIMKNAWIDESRSRTRRGGVFLPQEAGEGVGDTGSVGGASAVADIGSAHRRRRARDFRMSRQPFTRMRVNQTSNGRSSRYVVMCVNTLTNASCTASSASCASRRYW